MEKLRVFYDLSDEGNAPEPIGAIHEECQETFELESSERMIVDGTRAGTYDRCLVCE